MTVILRSTRIFFCNVINQMPYRRRYGRRFRRRRRPLRRRRRTRFKRYRSPRNLTHLRKVIVSRAVTGGTGPALGQPGTLPSLTNLSFSLADIDPVLMSALTRCWDQAAIYKVSCQFYPQEYFSINNQAVTISTWQDKDLFTSQQPGPTLSADQYLSRYKTRSTNWGGQNAALRAHKHTIYCRPVTPIYSSLTANGYQTQSKICWLDLQNTASFNAPHAGIGICISGSEGTNPQEPLNNVFNITMKCTYHIIMKTPV